MKPIDRLIGMDREKLKKKIESECSFKSMEPQIERLRDLLSEAVWHIQMLEAQTNEKGTP